MQQADPPPAAFFVDRMAPRVASKLPGCDAWRRWPLVVVGVGEGVAPAREMALAVAGAASVFEAKFEDELGSCFSLTAIILLSLFKGLLLWEDAP